MSFPDRENPLMESKFNQISQSHAGTLLRNRRLGSLSSVKSDEVDNSTLSVPLIQRTAIIQKDEKGYGLTVSGDNPVYVASVKQDGAAARAGVQEGDRIIKVNGKLVTNSNHIEVVKMIKSGSYVALTLLGRPPGGQTSNRDSIISDRDSYRDSITGPSPVDAEKEEELKKQKANTLRVMYDTVYAEYEKLRKQYKSNPSEKLNAQIQDKEKTIKDIEQQLRGLGVPGPPDPHSSPTVLENIGETSTDQNIKEWLPSAGAPRHVKHSSMPTSVYRPSSTRTSIIARSKSDVSARKGALSEYHQIGQGYRRTESSPEDRESPLHGSKSKKMLIRKAASMPIASDVGSMSDSPQTSPSTSPIPTHPQNRELEPVPTDSGIDDGSQSSVSTVSGKNTLPIIGMDDDEFESEEEMTGDSKVFSDLKQLETHPAHMSIFLHYVLNHHDPNALLFYLMVNIYNQAQGGAKDLKKWAYEIHSTFTVHQAPLKVNLEESIMTQIDQTLQYKSENEQALRHVFDSAHLAAKKAITELLDNVRQKKEQGLVEGSNELRDQMDKSEEVKVMEKYLAPDLDACVPQDEESQSRPEKLAQGWALATFLRTTGVTKQFTHESKIERVQSFVSKDRRATRFIKKSKTVKGHQFVLTHFYKQEFCMQCNGILWGVGYQGYQCQSCDQCVHKQCVEDLEEPCSKKRRGKSSGPSRFIEGFRKSVPPAGGAVRSALSDVWNTAFYPSVNEVEKDVSSPTIPTQQQTFNVFQGPVKDKEDTEMAAFKDQGHSVGNLVAQYNNLVKDTSPVSESPEKETGKKKSSDLGRSESMKGRGDQRGDRPARRSKSDVDMDDNMFRQITASGSSSNSSLSNRSVESPSGSADTLTQQIQHDSDFDVEPELPSLKQVLGEETYRKLKPKEKKRQDVINELMYTEKSHVRNLKILDKLFYRPMLKEPSIPQEFTKSLFPNLETMTHLHSSLNTKFKERRKDKLVVPCVGDLLLGRFDGEAGENFRNGCAIFCRNQSHMLDTLKNRQRKDQKLAQLLADAENNPLCQRLSLKDFIPKQMMRLTKYPLLIENLLKYTSTATDEYGNLERAHQCSKHILQYVNQAVKECENHQRLVDLQRKVDKKLIENSPDMEDLRTLDLSKHKLIYDGSLIWRINNRKQIELHVVLLETAMVLLQKQDDRLVLKCQSTQLVPGKEDKKTHSPLLWLNNILARNDATEKRAFFVVNTSRAGPQIYQLVAATAEEQKKWTKYITQASDYEKKKEQTKKSVPNREVSQEDETVTEVKHQIQIRRPSDENETPSSVLTGDDLLSTGEENIDIESMVLPEDVTISDAVIANAVPVMSTHEKLRQNDESLEAMLEERQGLIAELLNATPSEVPKKIESMVAGEDVDPQELILACKHQTSELVELVKDGTLHVEASANESSDSNEVSEDIDLTLPIPMDRLRDMANRMNQILTNLLAQTRETSSKERSQAAVNSRDEERDRLRRELKAAQDELNRLRKIQKAAAPLVENLQGGRPVSLVSESSTVSESGDEAREDVIQLEDQDFPGETDDDHTPKSFDQSKEDISEVSTDTLVASLDALGTEHALVTEESLPLPDISREELNEIEPPLEEDLEDIEPPEIQLVTPSDNEDQGESDSERNNGEIIEVHGEGGQIQQASVLRTEELETVKELESADIVDGCLESGDIKTATSDESQRDSNEDYQDAEESLTGSGNHDENGNFQSLEDNVVSDSSEKENSSNRDLDTKGGQRTCDSGEDGDVKDKSDSIGENGDKTNKEQEYDSTNDNLGDKDEGSSVDPVSISGPDFGEDKDTGNSSSKELKEEKSTENGEENTDVLQTDDSVRYEESTTDPVEI